MAPWPCRGARSVVGLLGRIAPAQGEARALMGPVFRGAARRGVAGRLGMSPQPLTALGRKAGEPPSGTARSPRAALRVSMTLPRRRGRWWSSSPSSCRS